MLFPPFTVPSSALELLLSAAVDVGAPGVAGAAAVVDVDVDVNVVFASTEEAVDEEAAEIVVVAVTEAAVGSVVVLVCAGIFAA